MRALIIPGIILTVLGLSGLAYCIWKGFSLRKSGRENSDIAPQLQKLIAINFGSLGVAAIGLMLIVVGNAL